MKFVKFAPLTIEYVQELSSSFIQGTSTLHFQHDAKQNELWWVALLVSQTAIGSWPNESCYGVQTLSGQS